MAADNNDVRHERELREQWQKDHEGVHVLEQRALKLAQDTVLEWKHEVNEVRSQIDGERNLYVRRDFYDEQHGSLRDAMDARLKLLETSKSNLEGRVWMMGAGISGIVIVLNLILRYWGK